MIPKAILEERLETRLLITHAQGALDRADATIAALDAAIDTAAAAISAPGFQNELLRLYHYWRVLSTNGDFTAAASLTFRTCADELNSVLLSEAR
jgi:hypothetical protein